MTALDVIIPALNAEARLAACLEAVVSGARAGQVARIVVADGGSTDGTAAVARSRGAAVIAAARGRGRQLAAGAHAATAPWLMFLHADTVLAPGWGREVARFIDRAGPRPRAAHFTLAFDDPHPAARRIAQIGNLRARWLGLPYGDQGLVLSRGFYDRLGGYRPLPLMEDVDLVTRIGGFRLVALATVATTSAERYRRDGWWRRAGRNAGLISLYRLGVRAETLARWYS